MRALLLTTSHSYRNEAFQRAATRLGIDLVYGTDQRPLPGQTLPPDQLPLTYDQPDAAAAAIASFARQRPVDAILAVDDSGVVLAAQAAARLGLAHNDPQAAAAARDKFLMRSLMAAAGVPCPWFRHFSSADDLAALAAELDYPCVVKPLHLNASRGVIRADDPAQFVAAAHRTARIAAADNPDATEQLLLVEGFLPGREVALEGMLDDGKLTVLALFDKPDPLDGPYFEETIYVTPSRLPATVQREIATCAADAARAIGLTRGPVHAELRVQGAQPWMLEVAGRSIGGLCSQTLRFDLDRSLEELILRQACGLPWQATSSPSASGVMMIPIPTAGILRAIYGADEARATPGIEQVEITASLHHELLPLPDGDSYLGFIFARGQTPEEVEAALRIAHAALHFEIVPSLALTPAG
ncbi:MAG: ATP-grasp domain-containing protein [Caldilineaceae bacterium]|nr:ATP-grasp domain-containing protein [Caldilineaceae bacterium]